MLFCLKQYDEYVVMSLFTNKDDFTIVFFWIKMYWSIGLEIALAPKYDFHYEIQIWCCKIFVRIIHVIAEFHSKHQKMFLEFM